MGDGLSAEVALPEDSDRSLQITEDNVRASLATSYARGEELSCTAEHHYQ